MRSKRNSPGKISALMWMAFGLIAAILGTIQSAVRHADNKESKKNTQYGPNTIVDCINLLYYYNFLF